MITVQIIAKNQTNSLNQLIDILSSIDCEILIGNISGDHISNRKAKIYKFSNKEEHLIRNNLAETSNNDWQLYLNEWEIPDIVAITKSDLKQGTAYYLPILSGDLVSYDIRLWCKRDKIQFNQYNTLDAKKHLTDVLPHFILSNGNKLLDIEQINKWKSNSNFSTKPIYYEAMYYIQNSMWDKFLAAAKKYLFNNNQSSIDVLMIKYYTAVVLTHIKKNGHEALTHIIGCLAARPLMAEYWCLLGDIYYYLINDYNKAKRHYQNAIILGSRRLELDKFPIEIKKYKEYPEMMIKSCNDMNSNMSYIKIE